MDTIAAISTAIGTAGVGIIRMSGKESFSILNKIFVPKNEGPIKGYQMRYGTIINEKGEVLDEVLVSCFVNPKSYTREDMCEINSHGGYAVEKRILEECMKNGARLAEPGEFTKRAFLNGRIDLTQAEAVIDIINAKTEIERKASVHQLEGVLSKRLRNIRENLLELMSDIEVTIDYPEYDVPEITNEKIQNTIQCVETKLQQLSQSYENGKIIKNGIKTAIVGKPNVGKSSLLNLLLNEERAIVSDIEGTTRDTIEENITIKGIELKVIDTAGIRNTGDEIEKIGVKKSIDVINAADLIISIFDDSRKLDREDMEILNLIQDKKAIILINKIDLERHLINRKEIEKYGKTIIDFSISKEEGIKELYQTIETMFHMGELENENGETITNLRQKKHIDHSIEIIQDIKQLIKENMTIDVIAIQIKEILEEIGNITGDSVSEDIINKIFERFCLGK